MVAGIGCLCNPFRRPHLHGIKLDDVTDNSNNDPSCNLAPKTRRKTKNKSTSSERLLPCNRDNDSSIHTPSDFPAGPSLVFSGKGKETTETTTKTTENRVKIAISREQYNPILPVNIESQVLPGTENKRSLSLSISSSSIQFTGSGRTSRFASLGSRNKSKCSTTSSKRTYNGHQQALINTAVKEEQSSQYDVTTLTFDTEIPTIAAPKLHNTENQKFSYSPSRRIEKFHDKTIRPNTLSNTNGDGTNECSSVSFDLRRNPSINKQSYEEIQDKIFRPTPFPDAADILTESIQRKDPGSLTDGEIGEKTQLSVASSQVFHFEDTTILDKCEVLSTGNDGETIDDFAESSLPSRPGTDHGESKPERPLVCSKSDSIGIDTISTTSHDAIGVVITTTNSSADSNQHHLSKSTLAAVAELDDIVRSLKNSIQESNARSPKHRQKYTQSKQSPSRTTSDFNKNSVSPISTSRSIKHVGISSKNSHERNSPERNSPEHDDTACSPLVAKARSCTSLEVNQFSDIGLNQQSSHSRTHDNSRGSEVPNCKRGSKRTGPLSNTKQSTAMQNSQENFLQKNSVTSYVDVLASSWDSEGDSDDEKASLYGDDDDTQDQIERTLSSLPDNVDPQVKRRYIAMCRLLKDALVSNKQVDLQQLEPADREIFSAFVIAKQENQNESLTIPVIDQTQRVADVGTGQHSIDISDHTYGQMSTSLFTAVESVYSAEFNSSSRIKAVPTIDRRHRGTTTERYSHTNKTFEVTSNDTRPISSSISRMSDTTPIVSNGRNNTIRSNSSSHHYTMDASTREFSTSSLFTNIEDEKVPFLVLGTDTLVNGENTILTFTMMEELRCVLPYAHADENFHLKFCSRRDGNSLSTLLHQVQWCKNTIFAIETRNGDVFGAFCSSFWHIQPKWFGSEQSFLWRMTKEKGNDERAFIDESSKMLKSSIEVFSWTGSDHCVQHCSTDAISIGGGGRSDLEENKSSKGENWNSSSTSVGLFIDGDLMSGETNPCATFGNTSLICEDKHLLNQSKFEILSIEVWTMTPCMTVEIALELEEQQAFVENHGFI